MPLACRRRIIASLGFAFKGRLETPRLPRYIRTMCGRITQKSPPDQLRLTILMGTPDDPRVSKVKARYNGAPSQELLVIRRHPKTGDNRLDLLQWGLIANWTKETSPKVKPINATAERVASAPMFRDSFVKRRCIVPVDNFFEWKAVKGTRAKQPFAIAMQSGKPFGIAGIWDGWRHPDSGEIVRTFCIITTTANELVASIHDRMPVILPPKSYDRWLANIEPDPRDLLVPFPSELMMMWPISTRVNKPDNDDPSILDPLQAVEGGSPTLL
jgi:putative SOS response-associated peptidase YedK